MFYKCLLLPACLAVHIAAVKSQSSLVAGSGTFISGGTNMYVRLSGDIRADGSINAATSSVWNFDGAAGSQHITCASGSGCTNIYNTTTYNISLGSVYQNNPDGIIADVNTIVKGIHYFFSGSTELREGNYWLTQSSPTPYAQNDNISKFFVTTGHGLLKQSSVNSAGSFYPVGVSANANNYTPIRINYAAGADDFGVRVFDNIYYAYNPLTGDPAGTLNNYRFVTKTWIINKTNRSTGDLFTVTPQWNIVNEDPAFTPHRPIDICIARNHDGFWFPELFQGPAVPPAGSGPFTYTGNVTYDNNLLAFYPVSVTAINVVLAYNDIVLAGIMKDKEVILTWQLTNENNTSFYGIQRSLDAVNFQTIYTRHTINNSVPEQAYNYSDKALPASASTIYYRIKKIAAGGSYVYSNIIALQKNIAGFAFVFPNPANDVIKILFGNASGEHMIQLTDITGKLIQANKVDAAAGERFDISVSNLLPGNYFINIINLNTRASTGFKVMINH